MTRSVLILVLVSFAAHSVVPYENAYDLLERRNKKLYEPRYFHPMFYNRRFHSPYSGNSLHYSKFGNGYDNLGNGIPGSFNPFRQQVSWSFERRPYRQRILNNFDGDNYRGFQRPHHEYINHRPTVYYSAPDRIYGDEFALRKNKDLTKVDRYFEDNEGKTQKNFDDFYQRNQEGVKADSLKKENTGEQIRTDQVGENKSSLRSNKTVKKGRTTTGFAIHHHKDETGNSTRFFDETSDFGGQSDLRDIADGFDSRKTLEQISQMEDEKYFTENDGKSGNYGTGLLKGNQKFEKDFSSITNNQESGEEFGGKDEFGLGNRYLNDDFYAYPKPQIDNY